MMDRRLFLGGLLAAPAVVRAGSLMPLRGEVVASSWMTGDIIALVDVRRKIRDVMKFDAANLAGPCPDDLFGMMAKSIINFPSRGDVFFRDMEFVTSGLVRQHMNIQAIRDRNVIVGPSEQPGLSFRDIPIKVFDY